MNDFSSNRAGRNQKLCRYRINQKRLRKRRDTLLTLPRFLIPREEREIERIYNRLRTRIYRDGGGLKEYLTICRAKALLNLPESSHLDYTTAYRIVDRSSPTLSPKAERLRDYVEKIRLWTDKYYEALKGYSASPLEDDRRPT